MGKKNYAGPERRTYFDMNPWYSKNKEQGINDWHQHVTEADNVLREKIVRDISKKKPGKVLEVGCGGGDFTLSYSNLSFHHIAFEFSSVAIDMAKQKTNPSGVIFSEGDVLSLESYSGGPFGLIIAKDVLHCILDEDRILFLQNMKQSLLPGGTIHLTTHVGLPETNENVMKYIDRKTRENHLRTRVYLDKEDIENEFIESGLKIAEDLELPSYLHYYKLEI